MVVLKIRNMQKLWKTRAMPSPTFNVIFKVWNLKKFFLQSCFCWGLPVKVWSTSGLLSSCFVGEPLNPLCPVSYLCCDFFYLFEFRRFFTWVLFWFWISWTLLLGFRKCDAVSKICNLKNLRGSRFARFYAFHIPRVKCPDFFLNFKIFYLRLFSIVFFF